MKKILFFILIFLYQVNAFAVTPTTIDMSINQDQSKNTSFKVFNDKLIPLILILDTSEELIQLPTQITIPQKSSKNIQINIQTNRFTKPGLYTNLIYLKELNLNKKNINLNTGLAIKTRVLVKGQDQEINTEYSQKKNTTFFIIIILIVILGIPFILWKLI